MGCAYGRGPFFSWPRTISQCFACKFGPRWGILNHKANTKKIVAAWKCIPFDRDMLAQFPGDEEPVYVVRYSDGTGNIVMGGKPSLRAGVAWDAEPEDFLVSCKPFYQVAKVPASQVPC